MCADYWPLSEAICYNSIKLRNTIKSFTLIELLIVIAVLGILAAAVSIILNPQELLAQSRDGTRLSDINSANSALNLALVNSLSLGSPNTVYVSIPDTSTSCADLSLPPLVTGWNYACVSSANLKRTNGNGWIPVDLQLSPSGSPLPTLPIDPINSTSSNEYYIYSTNDISWLLQAQSMESNKFKASYPSGYQIGGFSGPAIWRKNWVTNPSFEAASTFWTTGASAGSTSGLTNNSQDATHVLYGSYAGIEQSAGSTGQYYLSNAGAFSPTIGSTYTFSAYVFIPSGSPITNAKIGIRDWSTYNFLSSSVVTLPQNSWTRLSTTYTATAGNPQWRLTISDPGGPLSTSTIGTYWVDGTLLEQSSSLGSILTAVSPDSPGTERPINRLPRTRSDPHS